MRVLCRLPRGLFGIVDGLGTLLEFIWLGASSVGRPADGLQVVRPWGRLASGRTRSQVPVRSGGLSWALVLCVGVCLAGPGVYSSAAFGDGAPVSGGSGGLPLESPLGVSEGSSLLGEQDGLAAEEVQRMSPEAVLAREVSESAYERLGADGAAKLDRQVFSEALTEPAGGPPPIPAGAEIVGFSSNNVAQLSLTGGKHGVIDSLAPIALETSPGRRVPVSLALNDVGAAFEPATPIVNVRIPKHLAGGVELGDSGISLTPVDEHGTPLSGSEGVVDGAAVLYANTQTDTDTVIKPTTSGFDASTVLRSVDSPQQFFFHVGLPADVELVQHGAQGTVQILDEGAVIATVQAPTAVDATGRSVPVSMTVSGDTLVVTVTLAVGEYQYPVDVDPVLESGNLSYDPGDWAFLTDDSEFFDPKATEDNTLIDENLHGLEGEVYYNGDYGFFSYNTQGASRIFWFKATSEKLIGSEAPVEDQYELRTAAGTVENGNGEGGKAQKSEYQENRKLSKVWVCSEPTCTSDPVSGSEHNAAHWEQYATAESFENFYFVLKSGVVAINQEVAPSASFDTSDLVIEGLPNALLSGKWYRSTSNVMFGLDAVDTGIGVEKQGLSSPSKAGWGYALKNEGRNGCEGAQCNECYEPSCAGKSSGTGTPLSFSLTGAADGELPEGEDTVEGKVEDAAGLSATASAKVKIDSAPPHGISFSGLPSNHEISDGQHYALKASAMDGVTGTPSSGIASIVLEIDGQEIGNPGGGCSPGPCTGNDEWTLNGENYAAGEHTLTVVATDNAGNVASEEFHVKIHHAEGVAVGPGSVNPVTGQLSLTATDVSLGVPGGALVVSRSYRSRRLAQGAEGPLGSQWNLNLGAEQSLSRVAGGMILTSDSGEQVVFESKGSGEFTSPTGDAGMTLLEKTAESKVIFTLSENGSVTTFELPSGSSGGVWMPSTVEGPSGTNQTLYKFKLEGGLIKPKEELAPVPAGVSCGKEISELKEGCRALKFEYDEGATTAKGEKASEWGEYAGHLSKVRYIAWNASKTKTEAVVGEYVYDLKGRLRAEWDPQVTPSPVKTTYGYDAEGHVTAVSTSGHEPALLEQGTIPGDANPGRLMAVAVPSAATALGSGEAPVNSEAPTLSSTKPAVGTKINVTLTTEKTPGKWSASPLAFSYQWEDCSSAGKECSPIPGAVNEAYYPVAGDEGHTLVLEATALNATGAVTASSAVTSAVAAGTSKVVLPEPPYVGSDAVTTLEYQVPLSGTGLPSMTSTETAKWGQSDDPSEAMTMAIFPPDRVEGWPAKEYKHETIYYLDGKDRTVNVALPTGGVSTAEYNLYNDVKRTLSPDNRQKIINEGCKSETECKSAEVASLYYTENTYEETGTEPGTELLSTLGPQHTVKLAVGKEGKVNEETLAREHTIYSYNESAPGEGGPYHLVTKTVDGAETLAKEEFDRRTTETGYGGQGGLGWKLRKPTSVTTDPGGLNLVHITEYNSSTGDVIETKMPAASGKDAKVPPTYVEQFGSKGAAGGDVDAPIGDALDAHGDVWVADYANNRVDEYSSTGAFIETMGFGVSTGEGKFQVCTSGCKAGIAGSGNGQFSGPAGIAIVSGTIYVADYGNDRIEEFNEKSEYTGKFGSKGTGVGEFEGPISVAVASSGDIWVGDLGNARVDEFNSSGSFIETIGFGVSTGEEKFQVCTSGCKAGIAGSGNGQFSLVQQIALAGGNVYVADEGNDRVDEFKENGEYVTKFGSKGTSNGEFEDASGLAVSANGADLYVTDWGNDRVQEFTTAGAYVLQFASKGTANGQLDGPEGIAVNSAGDIYVVDDGNNRVEEWAPTITGAEGAHDTKTIYYTTAANSEYKECGEKPAMANLPCETRPAEQPGTSGLPELASTKYTYNVYDEPETVKETVGTTTRTKTDTYDTAGRLKTTATTSTVGTTLPSVTDEYNSETGALEKQVSTAGTITSIANKLGELESYTDAGKNKTSYEYTIDGLIKKINDEKGTETYTYSETTGLPTELTNEYGTSKLTFTATYDGEGNMLTEGYPNSMTAKYIYNGLGKPTWLEYKKEKDCATKCPEVWFSDGATPSIHGQWLGQVSTLSHQTYTYDTAGRLTEVQSTTEGKCTTRLYAYDEDSNRVSLTTRQPGTEGKCANSGGEGQGYIYDTADRLNEPAITYNTFGDITALPAQNTEDPELTSTYYTDNQVQSQTQNKQTITYTLDPAGRTLEANATGEPTKADILSHYSAPSSTPAWTENTSTKAWTRNINGIDGSLAATQNEGSNPVLQLTNLHGDIVATASPSETTTALTSKADTSEFGVPTISSPGKYAWLGSMGLPTELPSGVIAMGARSYVPQLGRFLQPDPVPGGSANAYGYTFGDPINTFDPTGAYSNTISAATQTAAELEGDGITAQGAGERQRAEREAAERYAAELAARAAAEAAAEAAAAAGPQYDEEWEEWEEWYEEEEYEYANDRQGKSEVRAEAAVLFQPSVRSGSESTPAEGFAVPLCKVNVGEPCAHSARGGEGTCKPCERPGHNRGGGGNGTETACAALGVIDFIPGVLESPPGFIATAFCAGYGVGRVVSGR